MVLLLKYRCVKKWTKLIEGLFQQVTFIDTVLLNTDCNTSPSDTNAIVYIIVGQTSLLQYKSVTNNKPRMTSNLLSKSLQL